jgi:hypothetical protein
MPASNVKLLESAMLQVLRCFKSCDASSVECCVHFDRRCRNLPVLNCLVLNVDLSGSRAGFEEKSIVRRSSPSGFYKAHVSVGGVVCWFGFSGLADFGKRTLHVPVAQF